MTLFVLTVFIDTSKGCKSLCQLHGDCKIELFYLGAQFLYSLFGWYGLNQHWLGVDRTIFDQREWGIILWVQFYIHFVFARWSNCVVSYPFATCTKVSCSNHSIHPVPCTNDQLIILIQCHQHPQISTNIHLFCYPPTTQHWTYYLNITLVAQENRMITDPWMPWMRTSSKLTRLYRNIML